MAETFTISAAARLCQCDRHTLQRAIHAGRLHLDAQHCLSREELLATGYLVPDPPQTAPQETPQETPHDRPYIPPQSTPQELPQTALLLAALERLARAIEGLQQEMQQLREHPRSPPQGAPHDTPQDTPQSALGAPQRAPQETAQEAPHITPQDTPQALPQAAPQPSAVPAQGYDPTRFALGVLCPRNHEYQQTGRTLRRLPSHVCPACDVEQQRERRAAQEGLAACMTRVYDNNAWCETGVDRSLSRFFWPGLCSTRLCLVSLLFLICTG